MTVRGQPRRRTVRVPGWVKMMAAGGAILFLTYAHTWLQQRGWSP